MIKKILDTFVEPAAFIVLFYVTINRIIFGGGWLDISHNTIQKVSLECILWILDATLFIWIAYQKRNLTLYWLAWKRNWILMAFIFFAAVSLFWSASFIVSSYKVFVLLLCSAIAAYIGITYPINIFMRKLVLFFIVITVLSYGIVIIFPGVGVHFGDEHTGAWRGLFFHKNILGIFMALGATIFLTNLFHSKIKFSYRLFYLAFYMLAGGLVIQSRSAAGILLFVIMNGSLLIMLVWLKLKNRLNRIHYILIALIFIGLLIAILTNLNFVFGLLNKNSTLTGRVPLWSFLLTGGLPRHPLIGSGFGFPWSIDPLRLVIKNAIGWGFAPITAHNGFIDMYLHFGLVGIILLSTLLLTGIQRSIRSLITEQTLQSFLPLLLMIFIVFSNLSESFFLEMESFAWLFLTFALFTSPVKALIQPEQL